MTNRCPWICSRNESVLNTTFSVECILLFHLSSQPGSVELKPNNGTIHYCPKQINQNKTKTSLNIEHYEEKNRKPCFCVIIYFYFYHFLKNVKSWKVWTMRENKILHFVEVVVSLTQDILNNIFFGGKGLEKWLLAINPENGLTHWQTYRFLICILCLNEYFHSQHGPRSSTLVARYWCPSLFRNLVPYLQSVYQYTVKAIPGTRPACPCMPQRKTW